MLHSVGMVGGRAAPSWHRLVSCLLGLLLNLGHGLAKEVKREGPWVVVSRSFQLAPFGIRHVQPLVGPQLPLDPPLTRQTLEVSFVPDQSVHAPGIGQVPLRLSGLPSDPLAVLWEVEGLPPCDAASILPAAVRAGVALFQNRTLVAIAIPVAWSAMQANETCSLGEDGSPPVHVDPARAPVLGISGVIASTPARM